ncbi:MAG: isochorismate synthase MenF [Pseudanabaenaceae cyanobacterium]
MSYQKTHNLIQRAQDEPTVGDYTELNSVKAILESVRQRSHQLNRPLIATITLPAPSDPPQGDFHWHTDKKVIIGKGKLLEIRAEAGRDRFHKLRQKVSYWLNECYGNPILMGGFSFYDQPDPPTPPALLTLPEWTWCYKQSTPHLQRNLIITPQTDLGEICQQLVPSLSFPLNKNEHRSYQILSLNEKIGEFSWAIAVQKARNLMPPLEKLVLARVLQVTTQEEIDPFGVLQYLLCHYPECTTFLLQLASAEYLVGASPELFLRSRFYGDHSLLETCALAGSMPRGKTPASDRALAQQLLTSSKNLREHQIVVHSILEALPADPPPPPQILALSNVQHLYTPISARWQTEDAFEFLEIMGRLHPTAAMAGAPRAQAIELMRQLETGDRRWYAAPIGWLDSQGNSEFVVGIRSGYIRGQQATLFAGSGILKDSDLEQELAETNAKFMPLLNALGINSLKLLNLNY